MQSFFLPAQRVPAVLPLARRRPTHVVAQGNSSNVPLDCLILDSHGDRIVFPSRDEGDTLYTLNAVFACSSAVANDLSQQSHVDPALITSVDTFVQSSQTINTSRIDVNEALGVPGGAVVIGGVGKAETRKGVDVPMLPLDRLVRRPGGHVSAFDVFAMTSREEPMGMAAIDAAFRGSPLVAFAGTGGVADMIGGERGHRAPYLDGDAMAGADLYILDKLVEKPQSLTRRACARRAVKIERPDHEAPRSSASSADESLPAGSFFMTFRHSNIFDALRRMFDPPAEPIVVCAACADGSGAITPSWAAEMRALRPSLVVIRVATCSDAIFETNCDTFGPAREVASYLLEMRSDLLLQEPGFDSVLIGALRAEPDLLAVSARGIYGWRKVVAPEGGPIDRFVGRLRARAGRHATLRLPCRIRHARTDGAQRVRRQPFRRGQRRP